MQSLASIVGELERTDPTPQWPYKWDRRPEVNELRVINFVEQVKLLLGHPNSSSNAVPSNGNSDLDQLEKLGKLFRDGILTNEEFFVKKKEILGL